MSTSFRLIRISILIIAILMSQASFSPAQKAEKLSRPKNVILLIGDGMGFNHILATDYYNGGKKAIYEEFPVRVAMAHYPAKGGEYEANYPASNTWATGYSTVAAWSDTAYLKRDFTESAAAATAMATGFKTYNNSIGMSLTYDTLQNLVELAKSLGKAAGVATSVPFSHATPAGFVAHNKVRTNYSEITFQMLLKSKCDVIMGCGNPAFDDNGKPLTKKWKDPKYVGDSTFWTQLQAGSGKSTRFNIHNQLFTVADCDGDGKPDPWTVVQDPNDFKALKTGKTPQRVLGCARVYNTLQGARAFSTGETKDTSPYLAPFLTTVPSLADMSGGALNILSKNKNGFFVMIEGGAVDWACHSNLKGRMIEEMNSFNEAVEEVVRWVEKNSNWDETLLIVTGDHETGLLWGKEPFKPIEDKGLNNIPEMKYYSANHSNSLIALFAKGAGSEWFLRMADESDSVRGPYIQNTEIPQLVHFLWAK